MPYALRATRVRARDALSSTCVEDRARGDAAGHRLLGFGGIGDAAAAVRPKQELPLRDMTRADKVASLYRVDAASGTRRSPSIQRLRRQEEFHAPGARGRWGCPSAMGGSTSIFRHGGAVVRQLTRAVARRRRPSRRGLDARSTSPARGASTGAIRTTRSSIALARWLSGRALTPEDAQHQVHVAPVAASSSTSTRASTRRRSGLRSGDGRVLRRSRRPTVPLKPTGSGRRADHGEGARRRHRPLRRDLEAAQLRLTTIYPVIDNIYPGPQLTIGPSASALATMRSPRRLQYS